MSRLMREGEEHDEKQKNFLRFLVFANDGNEDLKGLCSFLKNILKTASEEKSTDDVMSLMDGCFCDEMDEEGNFFWKKDPPSILFYALMLAAIPDNETRNELLRQIDLEVLNRNVRNMAEEINDSQQRLKMNYAEAFSHLEIVRTIEADPHDYDARSEQPSKQTRAKLHSRVIPRSTSLEN